MSVLAADLQEQGHVLSNSTLVGVDLDVVGQRVDACSGADAGTRDMLSHRWCRDLVTPIRDALARQGVPCAALVAIQCTLFRKSSGRNWKVALHQDLCVPVAERVADDAMRGWSKKQGVLYVQPPVALLDQMMAVRLHLDTCGTLDGPLCVVPGSHRYGRVTAEASAEMSRHRGRVECVASAGDLVVMRPLCLHASSKALRPRAARRVLHFLFGPSVPGYGLTWSTTV